MRHPEPDSRSTRPQSAGKPARKWRLFRRKPVDRPESIKREYTLAWVIPRRRGRG